MTEAPWVPNKMRGCRSAGTAKCGGKGEGPGELMGPGFVRWMPKLKVFAVYDWSKRKWITWDARGDMKGEYSMPLSLPDTQTVVDRDVVFFLKSPFREARLFRYEVATKTRTELWAFAFEKKPIYNNDMVLDWDAGVRFAIGDNLIAVCFQNADAIQLMDASGRTLSKFEVKMHREKVNNSYVDDLLETYPNDFMRATLQYPEYWPMIMGLNIDQAQHIWVTGAKRESRATHLAWCFDRKGKKVAETRLAGVPHVIRNQAFYYARKNASGDLFVEKVALP